MEQDKFLLLSALGDAKEHSYSELFIMLDILLRKRHIKVTKQYFENHFKRLAEYQLVRRNWKESSPERDTYMLTRRGDEYFRSEQIRRTGNYSFFKYHEKERARPTLI